MWHRRVVLRRGEIHPDCRSNRFLLIHLHLAGRCFPHILAQDSGPVINSSTRSLSLWAFRLDCGGRLKVITYTQRLFDH